MYVNYMIFRGKLFISICSFNSIEIIIKREKNLYRYRGIYKRIVIMKIL